MKKMIQRKKRINFYFILLIVFSLTNLNKLNAAAGFFAQGSGGGLISYTANGGSQINSYNWNSNVGVLYSLTLNGGIIHTFKDGSGNVCGGTMYWRVYKVGNTPGSFNTVSLGYSANGSFTTTATPSNVSTSNGNDQRWLNAGAGVNIFNDANVSSEVGACRFDVYFEFTGNTGSSSGCGTTVSLGSSGSPLQISFTKSRVSASSGAFNTSSTWSPSGVPTNNENIAISGTHAINLDANFTAASVVFISTGSLTVNSSQTLQIAGGVTGSGTFNVNGTLQVNVGGFTNIAPTYGSSSTLIYNSGTVYGRGTEWSTATGAGYPNNVQINSGTTLNLGNSGTGTARQCLGNLTINSGGTLSMNETGAVMTAALTVRGNFTNNGTITLSGSVGGDLILFGNLDDNGTFTANQRAIFFDGSNTQTINSTTDPLDIDVMRVQKTGGEIVIGTNLLVDETNDPLQVTTSASVINLNGKNLTIGKTGTTSAISMVSGSIIRCNSSSSILIFGNGALGTLRFDASNNTIKNLTVNSGTSRTVTLGNALNIVGGSTSGLVTVGSGSTLNTGGFLTLKSDANGTASIGNSAGTISGNVKVERYISGSGRRYRFLSSPVTSASIANWMDSIWVTGPGDGVSLGTTMTGTLWPASQANITYPTSGNDIKSVKTTSIRTYDETNSGNTTDLNSGFSNVSTTQTLTPGQGFKVFVRGPRKVGGVDQTDQLGNANNQALPSQNPVTLSLTGTVNQGDIVLNGSTNTAYRISKSTQGWNLIGNPYPCPYDIKAHYTGNTNSLGTNINTTIYIYNASTAGYASYNPTGSGTAGGSGLGAGIIPPGSAFFIQASSASPVFTFKEAYKTTTAPGVLHKTDVKTDQFEIKYYKDSVESDYLTVKMYDGATLDYDMYDIYKFRNDNLNLSAYGQDSMQLAATVIPPTSEETHVKLNVEANLIGTYKFDFSNMTNFNKGVSVSLFDRYTNKTTDVRANTTYTFEMGPNLNQWGKNRFELILNANSTTTGIASESSILSTKMFVYPNPASEVLNINISNSNFNSSKVNIYNISGNEVLSSMMSGSNTQLNIEGLSHGLYFVKVSNQNGFSKTMKFTK